MNWFHETDEDTILQVVLASGMTIHGKLTDWFEEDGLRVFRMIEFDGLDSDGNPRERWFWTVREDQIVGVGRSRIGQANERRELKGKTACS